jgi:hypothetical protein
MYINFLSNFNTGSQMTVLSVLASRADVEPTTFDNLAWNFSLSGYHTPYLINILCNMLGI